MAKKYCYLFTEGNATIRNILGGKGRELDCETYKSSRDESRA